MATQVTLNSGSVDSAGSLALKTNGTTTAVTIDTSQNVGIGITPAAWAAGSPVVQLAGYAALNSNNNLGSMELTANAYRSAGTTWNYIVNDTATRYRQWNGAHAWFNAASGTAGNTISFAQAMTLDSSGNLLVGTTSTVNPGGVTGTASFKTSTSSRWAGAFENSSSSSPWGVGVTYTGAAPNNTSNAFFYGTDTGGDRFYMRSNGGLANYSANDFNIGSDLRLKHDIEPVKSYWNVFKSLGWKTWLYNDQTDDIKNIGVIAQELQALAPELVCESNVMPTPEGESPYLGLWENDFKMAGMSVITELVKRCDEQQALITSLTDRITALEAK